MSSFRPSPEVIAERLFRLRQKMAESNLDGFFISSSYNRRYFSGYTAGDHAINESSGNLLVTTNGNPGGNTDDGKAILLVSPLHAGHARHDAPESEIEVVPWNTPNMSGQLAALLRKLRLHRIGFESAFLNFSTYHMLQRAGEDAVYGTPLAKPEFVPLANFADDLRVIKTAEEIEAVQKAIDISDAAYEHILTIIKPGMTEQQVSWEIEKFVREQGAEGESFPTIVASGPNSAIPHHATGDRAIREHEPILIDMGCIVEGYISDITRTFCLGEPDETFRKVYPIVLEANEATAKQTRPGMTGKEFDAIARNIIDASEYKDLMIHSVGHGIGLAVHEAPRGSARSDDVLKPGMLITDEPGIYIEGWGGVRIEDVLLITDDGARVLTKASKYMVK